MLAGWPREVDVRGGTVTGRRLFRWTKSCPDRHEEAGIFRQREGYHWTVEQSPLDDTGAGLALLGAELRERAGELADGMVARIRAAVPVYGTGTVISDEELRRTCLDNIGFVFGPIGRVPAVASPESRENGRRRAQAGVPLTAVMAAYRVAARYLWDCLADTAARNAVPAGVTLRAASEMWLALDTFTQEMADGYREEITVRVLSQEQERSAVIQALLDGRLDEANLWEAADILQIPLRGRYVVIAAQVPGPGRHALPQAEAALKRIGVISAWRLLHDAEVGIAWLPGPPGSPYPSGGFPALAKLGPGRGQPVLRRSPAHRPESPAGQNRAAQRVHRSARHSLRPRPVRRRGGQRPGGNAARRRHHPGRAGPDPGRPAAGPARYPRRLARQWRFGQQGGQRPVLSSQHGPAPDAPARTAHRTLPV